MGQKGARLPLALKMGAGISRNWFSLGLPEEPSPSSTLGFCPPELQEIHLCCLRPSTSWPFAAAVMDPYMLVPLLPTLLRRLYLVFDRKFCGWDSNPGLSKGSHTELHPRPFASVLHMKKQPG